MKRGWGAPIFGVETGSTWPAEFADEIELGRLYINSTEL